MAHSREKAKRWVREQASRFLESYFKESLGSRHPALTILRRLSAQVDHLTRKPKDGERSLKEILSILHENDISPFEVTQVWSLTQFYYADFSQSRIGVKKVHFQQTHNHGLRQLLTESWDLWA